MEKGFDDAEKLIFTFAVPLHEYGLLLSMERKFRNRSGLRSRFSVAFAAKSFFGKQHDDRHSRSYPFRSFTRSRRRAALEARSCPRYSRQPARSQRTLDPRDGSQGRD